MHEDKKKSVRFLKEPCKLKIPLEIFTGEELVHGYFNGLFEKTLKIELLKKTSNTSFNKASLTQVQFVYNGRRYQFVGRPKEVTETNIEIELKDGIENADIRRYVRHIIDFSLRVYFSVDNEISLGFIKNFSEGGFLFISSKPLKFKKVYPFAINLSLNGELETSCFSAAVVHTVQDDDLYSYKVGVEFEGLDRKAQKAVKNFALALSSSNIESIKKVDYQTHQANSDTILEAFSKYIVSWTRAAPAKKILCAESNKAERAALRKIFSPNYEVNFITNPLNAVEKVKAFRPDIMISEINLGDMDFFMMYETLEKAKVIKNIPFIIYSKNNNKTVASNALRKSNVYEYVVKPIMQQDLISRVERIIQK